MSDNLLGGCQAAPGTPFPVPVRPTPESVTAEATPCTPTVPRATPEEKLSSGGFILSTLSVLGSRGVLAPVYLSFCSRQD